MAVDDIGEGSVTTKTPGSRCAATKGRADLNEETAFEGTRQYTFSHALLRDVTYESVLRRVRRGYHHRVAEWLIMVGGDRVDEYAHLIANHFAQAGEDADEAEWQARAGSGRPRAMR